MRVCLVRSSSRQNIEYVQRLTKNTASVPGFCFNREDVFPRDHGNKYFNVVSFVECEWNLQTLITTHTKGWYHQCKKMLRLVPVNITIIKLNPQTSEENSEDFFLKCQLYFRARVELSCVRQNGADQCLSTVYQLYHRFTEFLFASYISIKQNLTIFRLMSYSDFRKTL